jgi:hypothetical protein
MQSTCYSAAVFSTLTCADCCHTETLPAMSVQLLSFITVKSTVMQFAYFYSDSHCYEYKHPFIRVTWHLVPVRDVTPSL